MCLRLCSFGAFWTSSSCNVLVRQVFGINSNSKLTSGGPRRKDHHFTCFRRCSICHSFRNSRKLCTYIVVDNGGDYLCLYLLVSSRVTTFPRMFLEVLANLQCMNYCLYILVKLLWIWSGRNNNTGIKFSEIGLIMLYSLKLWKEVLVNYFLLFNIQIAYPVIWHVISCEVKNFVKGI